MNETKLVKCDIDYVEKSMGKALTYHRTMQKKPKLSAESCHSYDKNCLHHSLVIIALRKMYGVLGELYKETKNG